MASLEAGLALDIRIAREFFGWTVDDAARIVQADGFKGEEELWREVVPRFSQLRLAAWQIIDHARKEKRWGYRLEGKGNVFQATFWVPPHNTPFRAHARTEALAICTAALHAAAHARTLDVMPA